MTSTETPAVAVSKVQQTVAKQSRIQSVDAIRGAVMILMALDHIRDFISSAAMSFSPTDLTRTTASLFFTRWITHFCAPLFAFTAGIGAFLWMRRNRSPAQLSGFLLARGIWLIFLELTVLRFMVYLQIQWNNSLVVLLVFWMLGLCMIVLAALIHLPRRWLAILSIAVIATHDLLDGTSPAQLGSLGWLWDILHKQAVFRLDGVNVLVAYPLIPWFAVMAAGFSFGPVLRWDQARRERFLILLGLGLTVAFILLRLVNLYGDPAPWSVQGSTLFSVLSFLNCTKYPPSLAFLLMTLGPSFLVMAALDRMRFSDRNAFIVFGRVPFFYYVVHLAVIHALAILLSFLRFGKAGFLLLAPPSMGSPRQLFPHDYGFSLGVVYAVWIAVIATMYPICRWYADLKQRRPEWWLSYL